MEGGDGMYAPRAAAELRPAARNLPNYAPAPGRAPHRHAAGYRGGYGGAIPPEDGDGRRGRTAAGTAPQPSPDMPAARHRLPERRVRSDRPGGPPAALERHKDVEIWAHDDTVVAGKTYRYKMRYRLKNPIFGAANAREPPDAGGAVRAGQRVLASGRTPITVPSLVNFFVAGGKVPGRTRSLRGLPLGPGSAAARDVSRSARATWSAGEERRRLHDRLDASSTSATTRGASDTQILLVNNKDGSVTVRSFNDRPQRTSCIRR